MIHIRALLPRRGAMMFIKLEILISGASRVHKMTHICSFFYYAISFFLIIVMYYGRVHRDRYYYNPDFVRTISQLAYFCVSLTNGHDRNMFFVTTCIHVVTHIMCCVVTIAALLSFDISLRTCRASG